MLEPHPTLDRIAIGTFTGLWLTATVRGWLALELELAWPQAALTIGFAALAGYVTADLLAGLTHWIADRLFADDTPGIGPLLIAPFRAHHVDPTSIARHDFATVSGNAALATAPLAAALFLLPAPGDALRLSIFVFATTLTLALFLTNTFHRWAHAPHPARCVRWLHRTGLVLTPARHARHHRGAHDCAYCVTSGWLNPLLDGLGIFPRLERVLRGRRAPREANEHEIR